MGVRRETWDSDEPSQREIGGRKYRKLIRDALHAQVIDFTKCLLYSLSHVTLFGVETLKIDANSRFHTRFYGAQGRSCNRRQAQQVQVARNEQKRTYFQAALEIQSITESRWKRLFASTATGEPGGECGSD